LRIPSDTAGWARAADTDSGRTKGEPLPSGAKLPIGGLGGCGRKVRRGGAAEDVERAEKSLDVERSEFAERAEDAERRMGVRQRPSLPRLPTTMRVGISRG
jgi:hypothetical protein